MPIENNKTAKLVAILAFSIGLLLFALSAQRAVAYFYMMSVPSSFTRALVSGREISEVDLTEAREAYLKALDVLPTDSILQQDFGRLELRRSGLVSNTAAQKNEALISASEHFRAAIAAAPALPFPWSLEARTRWEMSAPVEEINELLRISYFLGPHEGSSLLARIRIACRIWGELDDDVRRFASEDLVEIWRYSSLRYVIVDEYINAPMTTRSAIRAVIATDATKKRTLDQLLLKAVKSANSR